MMTSSNENIFRVTGPLCGEFTGPGEFTTQRPVTRNFDVFFDLRPNKLPWGWWFETLSWSLWRQRNVHWHSLQHSNDVHLPGKYTPTTSVCTNMLLLIYPHTTWHAHVYFGSASRCLNGKSSMKFGPISALRVCCWGYINPLAPGVTVEINN